MHPGRWVKGKSVFFLLNLNFIQFSIDFFQHSFFIVCRRWCWLLWNSLYISSVSLHVHSWWLLRFKPFIFHHILNAFWHLLHILSLVSIKHLIECFHFLLSFSLLRTNWKHFCMSCELWQRWHPFVAAFVFFVDWIPFLFSCRLSRGKWHNVSKCHFKVCRMH